MSWSPRPAHEEDIPFLEALIPLSVHGLQAPYYSQAQRDAAMGLVFGLDRQLIRDGTYYVVEHEHVIIAAGGWSRRKSLFGADSVRSEEDPLLDPAHDAARLRAFFVHPAWARKGLGSALLALCEKAIRDAGFHTIELVSTLAGEPLYTKLGYVVTEPIEVSLPNGLPLPGFKMRKPLA